MIATWRSSRAAMRAKVAASADSFCSVERLESMRC
jgi:hypothetical protein